jgi:hypothetical protein
MRRRLPRPLLAGCAALLFAALLPTLPPHPRIVVDELAYLGMARAFGGAAPMPDFQNNLFFEPGYPLLVSPAFWMGADPPEAAYRRVQGLNAGLLALLPLLLWRFLRRTGCGRQPATAAALVAAAYPALLVQARYAMPEVAFALAFAVALLACGRLVRAPAPHAAAAAGLAAASLPLLAPRGVPAAAALLLGVVWLALRRWISPRAAATFAAVLAGGWLALRVGERWLLAHAWSGDTRHDAVAMLAKLGDPHGLRDCARAVLGQLWYLAAGSSGIFAVGAAAMAVAAWPALRAPSHPAQPRVPRRERSALCLLLALAAAAVLLASGLHMTPGAHPAGHLAMTDSRIYGRYDEGFLPVLLALGLAALGRRGGARLQLWAAGAVVLLTCGLRLAWTPEPLAGPLISDNVLALAPFLGRDRFCAGTLLVGSAMAAVALLVALVRLAGRRPALATVALLFLAVAARGLVVSARVADLPSPVSRRIAELGVERVGYDLAVLAAPLYAHYQYQLPGVRFLAYDSRKGEAAPAPVVLSDHDVEHHPGAAFVWREEGQSLWVQRRLLAGGQPPFDYRREVVGPEPLDWVWREGVGRARPTPEGSVAPLLGAATFRVPTAVAPPVAVQLVLGSTFHGAVPLGVRLGEGPPVMGTLPPGGGILTLPLPVALRRRDGLVVTVTSPPPRETEAVILRWLAIADDPALFAAVTAEAARSHEGAAAGRIEVLERRGLARLRLECDEPRPLELRATNGGSLPWPGAAADGTLAVRWIAAGAIARTQALPLPVAVLPGRDLHLSVPLWPGGLAAGDYTVEVRAFQGARDLSAIAPLRLPVAVGDRWPLCGCR